ncbi:MAG: FtsX-like permease family protein [Chitinophagaceae bacterium]
MLAFQIALRYLRGKRGSNAAPLLSRISMTALGVGSCAMVLLFSVFNGFENVIGNLYTAFYSDIRVRATEGKFFEITPEKMGEIRAIPGITTFAPIIEDNVLVNTDDEQIAVTLRGVSGPYFKVNDLSQYIVAGGDSISTYGVPSAILGIHIAARLGLTVDNNFSRLTVYYPNADGGNPVLNPMGAFNTLELRPEGIFKVQEDFDARYVLAPLNLVQKLFNEPNEFSSLEMKLAGGVSQKQVQAQLRKILGSSFKVETRFAQNKTLNGVMRSEKWATYVILLFILLIASVNMIGAMSLLVLDKGKDMAVLRAMGASRGLVRRIFILEGMLWAAVGGGFGLLLGFLLCLGQQHFGWVKLSGDFIIQSYPISMQATDFLLVAVTVMAVGLLAAVYPALKAGKNPELAGESWRR